MRSIWPGNRIAFCSEQRGRSRSLVVSSKQLRADVTPDDDMHGLQIFGANGHGYTPTNWAFGQLAELAKAPAGYLRSLPAPMAADCLNYGLQFARNVEEAQVLLRRPIDGAPIMAAATGPRYGRIYNAELTAQLTKMFGAGDGVASDWRVPGIRKQALDKITKENTTLYASDRDMFVFLADERNRIDFPAVSGSGLRRAGGAGLARGFMQWNSEVGAATMGNAFFLFDEVCENRIIWGVEAFKEIKIRHSVTAPDRWRAEVEPALIAYQQSAISPIEAIIKGAQERKIDDLAEFLKNRKFSANMAPKVKTAFEAEEERPIETLWDTVTGLTAYAKSIPYQNERVKLEREAGKILDLAA